MLIISNYSNNSNKELKSDEQSSTNEINGNNNSTHLSSLR